MALAGTFNHWSHTLTTNVQDQGGWGLFSDAAAGAGGVSLQSFLVDGTITGSATDPSADKELEDAEDRSQHNSGVYRCRPRWTANCCPLGPDHMRLSLAGWRTMVLMKQTRECGVGLTPVSDCDCAPSGQRCVKAMSSLWYRTAIRHSTIGNIRNLNSQGQNRIWDLSTLAGVISCNQFRERNSEYLFELTDGMRPAAISGWGVLHS